MKADIGTETDINTLVASRIYGAELPDSETANMPEKAIVITMAGGMDDNSMIEIAKQRIDVFCYGETYYEAGIVDRDVYTLFKYIDREKISSMLIHNFSVSGGGIQLRESAMGAPTIWRSYIVTASEIAV